MSLLLRLKDMLFTRSEKRKDTITPDVSRAVQRNEAAGERAQAALEKLRMADAVKHIAGKM